MDRLLNQIRFCKRAGSKNVFFKTRFDTRMTPGGIRERREEGWEEGGQEGGGRRKG